MYIFWLINKLFYYVRTHQACVIAVLAGFRNVRVYSGKAIMIRLLRQCWLPARYLCGKLFIKIGSGHDQGRKVPAIKNKFVFLSRKFSVRTIKLILMFLSSLSHPGLTYYEPYVISNFMVTYRKSTKTWTRFILIS